MEPYEHGMLDVGAGNQVYWETVGNPEGKPAVFLHGGPGAPSKGARKSMDPEKFRIVIFHQRGCGQSTPHAADPAADMGVNTTDHLIADMEKLRELLGIEKWLVYGGSWGTTLAVAYAQRHPERVSEMILIAVTMSSDRELEWLYKGVSRFFPEAWARYSAHVGDPEDVVRAYAGLMESPDREVREKAAIAWSEWEDTVLSLESFGTPNLFLDKASDDMIAFVRICAHYCANRGFVGDLLGDAGKLAGIPAALIHGRRDMSCPADTAYALARAWPDAELTLVDDSGHKGSPAFREAIGTAVRRFSP
ncbi:prolyl aminopeptidase Serine peptidase. MEROPS family S33 [Lentzea waywayandensis]|uniref:Proline iminopeptidase n=1 Tax=Lentzea waywayandensis TaxID=84724 RepID=A0A1I6FI51_9PSEU|nr:prolyl aminopeptidase [Lentzea waywayandensis]SFR29621.1 prolyl aminopeptidase Serine peptidase. MEROPS family S33 [Lentzea waywayandensis]